MSTIMASRELHYYQGGSCVELLTASGSDPLASWALQGSVKREFHQQLKGYVVSLTGSSATTSLQLPSSRDKRTLGLVQPHLVLQLLVPHQPRVLLELSLLDSGGCLRRMHISSSQRELSVTPQCGKIPLHRLPTAQWTLLCIDVASLVRGLFTGQEFRSLERVSIAGSCHVRRVFTMKELPSSVTDIPSSCQPPPSSPLFTYVLLNYTVASRGGGGGGGGGRDRSVRIRRKEPLTHVAFGQRIPVPSHIANKRNSPCDDSGDGMDAVTGQYLHISPPPSHPLPHPLPHPPPHPPSQPLSSQLLRVHRRKDKHTDKLHPSKGVVEIPQVTSGVKHCELSHDEELAVAALQGCGLTTNGGGGSVHGVYSYRSPPHSATRQHCQGSPTTAFQLVDVPSFVMRGAPLNEDFMSPQTTSSASHQEYDYRKYGSGKEEEEEEEEEEEVEMMAMNLHSHDDDNGLHLSLNTRLAHGLLSVSHVAGDGRLDNELGNSGTLGSTGDGELTDQLRAAIESNLHETLDLADIGGPLSPTSASRRDEVREEEEEEEEELELLYDSDLNCFYDPSSGKYYELIS